MQQYALTIDYSVNGIEESYCTGQGDNNASLDICAHEGVQRLTITLCPKQPILLRNAVVTFHHTFTPDDSIFLNGYQSWTDSHEMDIHQMMPGLTLVPDALIQSNHLDRYGDYRFARYPQPHGFTYAYIRRGESLRFFGSLSECSGFTAIYIHADENTVTMEKDCENLLIDAPYEAFDLCLCEGKEQQVFDLYFAQMGIIKPSLPRSTGYTTWYQHYEHIDWQVVTHNLQAMAAFPYPFDVFQIDDGYQTAVGDWLAVDRRKFPEGMKPVADAIIAQGMTPGLWLAPFCAQKDSRLAAEHPQWLVQDDEGKPVCCGSNWGGFYALDVCNPQVLDYLANVFDVVLNQWGYGLVKLDFLYAACVQPRPRKTRGQIMCEAMDFLRACVGDKRIIGCGVPLGAAFGKVDYCRIGCDVSLSWDDEPHENSMHRERISTKNTILNTVFRRQLHGRAFLNDPDVFLLREGGLALTAAQKDILAQINCLCGGLLFTSDDVSHYGTQQRTQLLSRLNADEACIQSVELAGDILTLRYRQGGRDNQMAIDMMAGKWLRSPQGDQRQAESRPALP